MAYTSDPNRGQPIYTSSGIDASMLPAQHHISFIPVPLTHNVEVSPPNTGGYPIQTNITTSSVNTEPRPKPQIMILEKMKQLRDEGKYCDLFIDVKGMRFIAHKSLVAAWSPYFDEALTNTNYVEKDLLIIHYDSYEVFSDLLEFFYTGNILPRETNFLQLLHLAVSFKIDLLKSYCEEFLRCNLHLGNCVSTYFLSRKYSLESLEEFIVGFLQSNLSDTVKQSEFLQMKAGKFHALLSKGSMLKLKPEIKLFLVISWVGFEVQAREKYLVLLLKHIDWSSVASDFLLEISRTENFFTTHESSLYLLLQTLFSSGISLGPYKESFSALRHTYSHLLSEVVHSGVILPETDEFVAVTAVGTTTRTMKHDAAVNTDMPQLFDPFQEFQYTCTSLTNESSERLQSQNVNEENLNESSGIVEDMTEEQGYTDDNQIKQEISNEQLSKDEEKTTIRKSKRGKPKKKIMSKESLVIPKSNAQSEYQLRSSPRLTHVSNEGDHSTQSNYNTENNAQATQSFQDAVDTLIKADESDEKIDNKDEDYVNGEEEDENIDDNDDDEDFDVDNADIEIRQSSKKAFMKKSSTSLCKAKYVCPHCKYTSTVESRFKKHLRWNHENNVILRCTICRAFETKSNRSYNDHMKTHFEGPPFTCEVFQCDYTTDKFQSLLIHRMKHAEERPFPCDICGARFRTRNNLYAHGKTHTGKRPWQCPSCPKSFAVKNTLDQHMVTHDDLRPYLCDLCGFATKYQSHLTAHKRTHTGDMFKCEYPKCNYETPKRSQLKCHMRTHLGIRSFTCAECGKSFIEKSHLKRHEKIHTSDKPFKCMLCDYATARKDKLKYHFTRSHEMGGEKKNKGRPMKAKKKNIPKQDQMSMALPETLYVHGVPKNFDHSGYTIQGISADGTNNISLDDIRRAQFGGNLEGITIQVPVSMDHLVIPLDHDSKSSISRPLPANSPVTPVTLIPEDHQMYIQNVMTQVPMTTVQAQQQQQSAIQHQDYGSLGAFMALF